LLVVYLIVKQGKGKDERTYWNRAGAAFENRDGSINVKLDMFPGVNFQIREPKQSGDSAED
jgi:hypothetical protein